MTEIEFPIPVGDFSKNSRESIKVALTEFGGYRLVDARIYANDKATPRGLAIQVRQLPELIGLLRNAAAKARELGLIDGDA